MVLALAHGVVGTACPDSVIEPGICQYVHVITLQHMIYRHENRISQLASVEIVNRRIGLQGLPGEGVGNMD